MAKTIIKDFRGKNWELVHISRQPQPGKDGKVVVKDETGRSGEFYWAVFPGVDFTKF